MVTMTVFTTLHFIYNLQMGPTSWSDCSWQAFLDKHYVTLTEPICKLQGKLSVVNMVTMTVFTTLHFLHNLQMDPISWNVSSCKLFRIV
jgi:hypothetical protein